MKDIRESLNEIQDITPYLKGEKIDEGLKEIFNTVKAKFKQAFIYLKGVVAKFGTYFLAVDKDGEVLPAITPLTAGAAYADGSINKATTVVIMDKEGAKITGCKGKFSDIAKLKGPGNSINYWLELLNESADDQEIANVVESYIQNVNEVQLRALDPEAEWNRIEDSDELREEILMHVRHSKELGRLMIWGAPGIGKTAIVDAVVEVMQEKNKNYRMIYKTLSSETPDNFVLPDYVVINGEKKATDIPKTWLPVYKPTGDKVHDAELDKQCGEGLLFVDELSRAKADVLNVILPLVNEGRFGDGYKVGSGWSIIVASNRPEDETNGGQTKIGNALSNRFDHVYFEPTIKSWRKWADQQGYMSPLLLQWLSMPEGEELSGGKFYYWDPNQENPDADPTQLMCTPRSWDTVMKKLALYSHTGTLEGFTIFEIPESIIKKVLNNRIPKTAISSFMAFLKVIREIGNFDDAVYAVWKNGGKGLKIDKKKLNMITLPLAQLICSAHANELPTAKEWESMCDYLVSQNSDQLASYVLDIFGNTFFTGVDKELWGQIFTMQERIRRAKGDESKLRAFRKIAEPFCTKWNISFEEIPDFYNGLKNLTTKYGASFQSAIVGDHMNALG